MCGPAIRTWVPTTHSAHICGAGSRAEGGPMGCGETGNEPGIQPISLGADEIDFGEALG